MLPSNGWQPSMGSDMPARMNSDGVYCSFCGKGKDDVAGIVAGPNVFICDECIGLCVVCLPIRSRLNALAAMLMPRKWRFRLAGE